MLEQLRQEALATGCYIFWKDPKKESPKPNTDVLVSDIRGDTIEAFFDGRSYQFVSIDGDFEGSFVTIVPVAWAYKPKFNGVFS